MVLKNRLLTLILIICIAPGIVLACDPNFQAVELFSLKAEPTISPGIILLCTEIFTNESIQLPQSWESISINGNRSGNYLGEVDRQFFLMVMNAVSGLVHNLQNKTVGRLIINTVPILAMVSKDGLRNEGWQTIVMQFSIPIVSRLVVYEPGVAIKFIDEIDSGLNFSLTMAWPPVLVKHIRIWNRQGMIYSWPEEDISFEGEQTAQ